MTIEEVLDVARQGAQQGCTEVLLTLGESFGCRGGGREAAGYEEEDATACSVLESCDPCEHMSVYYEGQANPCSDTQLQCVFTPFHQAGWRHLCCRRWLLCCRNCSGCCRCRFCFCFCLC